ncbi:hypothetical protein EUTSA_v10017605mg [Eutrema salsugineum]|uniref:Uncharacterized protein n=1 Tax=Eutrema salsugineum TaxID=72664 RepID=V4LL17_EUTSA|nr:hypothetical protein EUTSA_v10017605mg [Eutrema salsugineum]
MASTKEREVPRALRQYIWNLRTLPKVKQFLWRAAVEALPVGVELVRRGFQVDFGCKICGIRETITHVLRVCQFTREVWTLALLKAHPHLNSVLCLDFLAFIPSLMSLPPTGISATSLPIWICWNLWITRNHRLFADTAYTAREVISEALGEARAWKEAQSSLQKPQASQATTTLPPPAISVICNVDATWHAESEAWALREALFSAIDVGFDEMQVRSDSQVLINLINSQETHTEIYAIVNDLRQLVLSFSLISSHYVPRLNNVEADTLAKNALRALKYQVN